MWSEKDNYLSKTFHFADFDSAYEFGDTVRTIANKLNHHPTLIISWGVLEVRCSTHDQGDIVTAKDWELAQQIDLYFIQLSQQAIVENE